MYPKTSTWRLFFILAALEAGAAFFALVEVPRTGVGFSLSRLMLFVLLAGFIFLGLYFSVRLPADLNKLIKPLYAILSSIFALLFAIVLFLLRYLDPARFLIYYQRISPVLVFLIVLTIEYSFFVIAFRYGFHHDNSSFRKANYLPAVIAFTLLIFTFLFVAITRVGITPDNAYWGEPGVPLMGWQFGLAILIGVCIFLINIRIQSTSRFDRILPTALWLFAIVIWINVPVSIMQNSFYAPMTPPTNQPFPNSDAGYYDSLAQSLLIGYPYLGNIPTRPLYIVILAAFHLMAGDRYNLIIAGQTFFLALIPVILYYLGKKLHSRAAGVILGLFAIFREWTSLLISSQTRVSNTKTLLVDLPTLLMILVTCLFVLRWFERKDSKSGFIAGGLFGVLLLLRTQSILILPVLFILVILAFGVHKLNWIPALVFFLTGFAITVTPWLLHNYLKTGQITFDAPFEYQVVASQYKYTGNLDLQNVNLQGKSLLGILLTFTIKDPKFVLGFITAHFFATQIDGLLVLPMIEPYNGLFSSLNLYWLKWSGNLSWFNILLLIFYLAVIAVGLGAVWKRLRWIGLVPLIFSLGYSLANGVGRFSGWRYDLPADWISYFYFGIGAAEILASLILAFGAKSEMLFTSFSNLKPSAFEFNKSPLLIGIIACGFVLVGALPWVAEGLVAPRYLSQTSEKLVSTLLNSSSVQQLGINRDQIETFKAGPQSILQIGRVLYPRFFTRDQGLASSHPWPAYAPRDFPRLGFVLINQSRKDVVFPSRTIPDPFPSASDAIILGCQQPDYLEVRLILFPDFNKAYISIPLSVPCN